MFVSPICIHFFCAYVIKTFYPDARYIALYRNLWYKQVFLYSHTVQGIKIIDNSFYLIFRKSYYLNLIFLKIYMNTNHTIAIL